MSMYNEYQKDDYLLKSKLLGITDFKSLEKAESFVFLSCRSNGTK